MHGSSSTVSQLDDNNFISLSSSQPKGLKRTHSADDVQSVIDHVAAGDYVMVTTKQSNKSKKSKQKQKQSLKAVPLQQFIRESTGPISSINGENLSSVSDNSLNISELSEHQFDALLRSSNTIAIQTDLSYINAPIHSSTHSSISHLPSVDFNLSSTVSDCISALIMPVSADVIALQNHVHDLLIAVQQLSGQVEFLLSHSSHEYSRDKPVITQSDQRQHQNQHPVAEPNQLPVPTYSSVVRSATSNQCPAPNVDHRDMSAAGRVRFTNLLLSTIMI